MSVIPLDSAWIAANPPPVHGGGTTKNSRGHVVVVGGARGVPGAPRLTAEAALRAGAGKVQVATIASAVIALGTLLPEAGMLSMPEDDAGELAATSDPRFMEALGRCGAVVVGPGMGSIVAARAVARQVVDAAAAAAVVLDAAAILAADRIATRCRGALLLTPNHDEMARLLDVSLERVGENPEAFVRAACKRFDATVVLKGDETHISTTSGECLHYPGGGVGLATGGSGDVLAGAIASLLSRGMTPFAAAGWGVWLHGQAARRLAAEPGPVGFLARELPGQFPRLLPQ